MKRCGYFLPTGRVTNSQCGLKECQQPATWKRFWNGGERFYCEWHQQVVAALNIVGQHWERLP